MTRRSYEAELIDAMNVRGMGMTDVAATTIGPFDLFRGAGYLKEMADESGLPIVSANVHDELTGELFVEPYVIVERGGMKFAVTGVLDPDADIRTHRDIETLGITVSEPMESLETLVPMLREKADFVVLLSQLGLEESKLLAEELQGIDFMLLGGVSQYSGKPFEAGQTVMLQPGYKGQRISDFRMSFGPEGEYTGYDGATLDLGDKVPSDASMALVLKEHKIAMEEASRRRTAERKAAVPTTSTPQYVEECLGMSASCVRCHQEESDQWRATAHAHAFATLETGLQSTNPECLRCHSTCYVDMPTDGSVTVKEHLRNVQCEACHGRAADHARDGSYGKVTEAACKVCHDKENSPDFDFATYLPQVAH